MGVLVENLFCGRGLKFSTLRDCNSKTTYHLLSYSFPLSMRKRKRNGTDEVRQPNGTDEASFCKDEFSFTLIETLTNFSHNSLKEQCCSGKDVLAILTAGFLKTTRVLKCFRTAYKMKMAAINFLAQLLGSPLSCSLYYP